MVHAASHVVLLEPSGFRETSHAQELLLQMYAAGGGAATVAGAAAVANPAKTARAIVVSSTRATLASPRRAGGVGGARGGTILVGHRLENDCLVAHGRAGGASMPPCYLKNLACALVTLVPFVEIELQLCKTSCCATFRYSLVIPSQSILVLMGTRIDGD